MPEFEFHVSRQARDRYAFDEALFGLDGRVILADFAAARRFAESMTRVRSQVVPAGDINAMGLIDEILHILIRQYEMQNPGLMQRALAQIGDVDTALLRFTEEFPPLAVYRGELDSRRYLDMETASRPNRVSSLEELFILHLHNNNQAFSPYHELFDDTNLRKEAEYPRLVSSLQAFFTELPGLDSGGETLLDMLTASARVAPHSLIAQLQFLLQRWGG
jgi:hypothetical protein